jgi:hypothetical protein
MSYLVAEGEIAKNWCADGTSRSRSTGALGQAEGFLDRGVYKISLSHVGFALLGTSRTSSCLALDPRKLLKTFILIAGCANKGNWHFPCKTRGGIGKDQRLSPGLHHRVSA